MKKRYRHPCVLRDLSFKVSQTFNRSLRGDTKIVMVSIIGRFQSNANSRVRKVMSAGEHDEIQAVLVTIVRMNFLVERKVAFFSVLNTYP